MWNGAGDNNSAFLTQHTDEKTEAYTMAASQMIPFGEWVRTAEFMIWKKKGHIAHDYPDKKDEPRGNGQYNDRRGGGNNDRHGGGNRSGRCNQCDHRSQQTQDD